MFVKFLIIFNYKGTDSIFLLKTLLDLNKGLTRILTSIISTTLDSEMFSKVMIVGTKTY